MAAKTTPANGKSLVIVESPAKAKTISRFLGPRYEVLASFGHIRDLPEKAADIPAAIKDKSWARIAVDLDGSFEPHYVVPADKKKRVAELKEALKGASELLLATDEDREGESISWHLLELLKPKVPVRRIVFHEITDSAIREAVANPRSVDDNLVRAQESRRIIDRLYGYSLSPVLWRKVQSGLSAGRVQSVAVRLVVEREEERRAFRKAGWWNVEATFTFEQGSFKAEVVRLAGERLPEGRDFDPATGALKPGSSVKLLNEEQAKAFAGALDKALPWRVSRIEEKPATQRPSAPFITSTLQQEASRKLGYGASRTMRIAQRLYEGVDLGEGERTGLITYMRTDSTSLSEKALRDAANLVRELYGPEYHTGPRAYQTKTRNAQEAHEAIRPTELTRKPKDLEGYLEADELRLYELIWKRTVASQMADARLRRTVVDITATLSDKREAVFTASGKAIEFPGFLRAYVEGSDDPAAELGDRETLLPPMREGQEVPRASSAAGATAVSAIAPRGHETTPPARYTEASLIKKLEEEGIGRPSTYASIIGTIQDRGYVLKQGNALVPTFTAFAVIQLLRNHFGEYVDIQFTARLEEVLDRISNGETAWLDFVRGFYRDGLEGHPGLEGKIAAEEKKIEFPSLEIGTDPESGMALRVRLGKFGAYIQRGEGGTGHSATIPEGVTPADFTVEKALEVLAARSEGPRIVGKDPATGLTVFAANGRFGSYVQLGENPEKGSKEKPRRSSIPAGSNHETIGLAEALALLALPRLLGRDSDGEEISASIGPYGPYVKKAKDFRSLGEGDDVHTVTLERALELLAQPKTFARRQSASSAPLRELGSHGGNNIVIKDGRFGAYVTDGTTNATLPKSVSPDSVTLEQAVQLIADRAAAGPSKKKAPPKRRKK